MIVSSYLQVTSHIALHSAVLFCGITTGGQILWTVNIIVLAYLLHTYLVI